MAVAAATLFAVAYALGPLGAALQLGAVQLLAALVALGAVLLVLSAVFGATAADAVGLFELLVGYVFRAPLPGAAVAAVDGPHEEAVVRRVLDGRASPLPLVVPQLFALYQLVAFRARALGASVVLLAVAGGKLVVEKLEQLDE